MIRRLALLLCLLAVPAAGAAQQAVAPDPALADPQGLLPDEAKQRIDAALRVFHEKTGRRMAMVVALEQPKIRAEDSPGGVGIVVAMGPDKVQPALALTDPNWVAGAPTGWAEAVAGVLETRFRHLPFADRAVRSVTLLARVLPDKLAFMERPPRRISAESVLFSKWTMGIFGLLVLIGYVYIAWRCLVGNEVTPRDRDPFSRELKQLRKEENTW